MTAPGAARRATAVARWPSRAAFAVRGTAATAFLQRVITADVSNLGVGNGTRSLLLDVHGHVLADLDVWADADGLVVGAHVDTMARALDELARRVLRADVTLATLPCHSLAIHGPTAAATLRRLGIEAPDAAPYRHRRATVSGASLHVRRTARVADGLEVAATDAQAIEELLGRLRDDDRVPLLDHAETVALRVEAGVPEWGAELTGHEFPQELGLDAAVSFDKGCYLGQETVARIHYRGHVNRHLRGLRLSASTSTGATLRAEGVEAGSVTTAARSEHHGDIAMGWVRRAHAADGTRLQVGEHGEALVVELPFA